MQNWTRWQSGLVFLAGSYAALSPMWTDTDNMATWAMVVLGVAAAAASLWSMARPDDRVSEYALVLIGVLFIASPWVIGFTDLDNLALTAWIVGAATAIMGLLAMPEVTQRIHHRPIAH